ncbi:MAG: hypothetical protein AAGF84_12540 [Planctomycetota bacterium]
MITSLALFFLHRALDERQPVPPVVRLLGEAHAPTARAVAEILDVHGALANPDALALELGRPVGATDAVDADAAWSRPDPAWWAAGGVTRQVAAVAAVLALAALVALVTLGSGPNQNDGIALVPPTPNPIAVQLPSLPTIHNPLATPTQAVRTALTPVADPAAALRQGVQRLGQGLEAPLRREWSAIVTQLDAMVRLTGSTPEPTAPAEPPADAPSTSRHGTPEPIASMPV